MNVTDVANRVKRLFGDEGGVQITDADIIRWANDAQLNIVVNNDNVFEATGTANIVKGQADYTSPTNIRSLRSLQYNGFRLRGMSFNEFNEYCDGFDSANFATGTPEVYMVWNDVITLFPVPNVSITNGLVIYYQAKPVQILTLADALTVPEEYHLAVVNYCLSQAYELDENQAGANFKKQEFDQALQRLSLENKELSQDYYPRITTLPDDENYYYGGIGGMY